jgi:hypothetical protein
MNPYLSLTGFRLCLFSALLLVIPNMQAVTVQTVGRAPGDDPAGRQRALADALRLAVEQGAGVELLSKSGVRDFQLVADQIVTGAFGFVRSYKILDSGIGPDGLYRVSISADVEPGEPARGDALALRNLVRQKGSPRVAFIVEEQMEDLSPAQRPVKEWLEAAAREMQLNVVSLDAVRAQEARIAARDGRVSPGQPSSVLLRLANEVDYIIDVKIAGRALGKSDGSLPHHRFAVSGTLRSLQPDTGKILAAVPIEGADNLRIYTGDAAAAARQALVQALNGSPGAQSSAAGWMIFRKLLVAWAAEVDLGSLIRVELPIVSGEARDEIIRMLNAKTEIGAVWFRSLDAVSGATIDLESRLPAHDVARLIEKTLRTGAQPDLISAHFVRFAAVTPARGAAVGETVGGVAFQTWLIGAGVAAVVIGAIGLFLGLRRR